jgi:hypothetical protein
MIILQFGVDNKREQREVPYQVKLVRIEQRNDAFNSITIVRPFKGPCNWFLHHQS